MATRNPAVTAPAEMIEVRATARFIRMSPTKVRQVIDLIRGRHVDDARRVLRFSSRAAAVPVAKVLDSAIANAEHNRGLTADELVVARAWVDEGPTLRRFRPRAMGRATRIRKRTCHISVVVGRAQDLAPASPTVRQTTRRVRNTTVDKKPSPARAAQTGTASEATPKKTTRRARTTKKEGDA